MINGGAEQEEEFKNCKIIHIPDKPPIPPHLQPTVKVHTAHIQPKHANTLIRVDEGKIARIAPFIDINARIEHFYGVDMRGIWEQYGRDMCGNVRIWVDAGRRCYFCNEVDKGECQLSIILCLAPEDDDQLDTMPKDFMELINSFQLSTFVTNVYKYAASTKEEWEEQCKLWPTSYHPPTYNIDGIIGFSKEDSLSVLGFMTQAITLAKSGNHQMVNAAVIVDPLANQVIATACDQVLPKSDPPCNSTMGSHLPRLNASEQEGSHMPTENRSPGKHKHLPDGAGCLHPWKWAQEQLNTSSGDWHPLKHAAIVAIEHAAARDLHLFPTNCHSKENFNKDDMVSFPVESPSKKQKIGLEKVHDEENEDANGVNFSRPYLCTGYDIYLVWEPCAMCAMARPSKGETHILCFSESLCWCSGKCS